MAFFFSLRAWRRFEVITLCPRKWPVRPLEILSLSLPAYTHSVTIIFIIYTTEAGAAAAKPMSGAHCPAARGPIQTFWKCVATNDATAMRCCFQRTSKKEVEDDDDDDQGVDPISPERRERRETKKEKERERGCPDREKARER